MADADPPSFIVFADDWGEHPSSSQHIFRQLVRDHDVLWVNTIGMRSPRLSWTDFTKACRKVARMARGDVRKADQAANPRRLHVCQPLMLPFSSIKIVRWFNRRSVVRAVSRAAEALKLRNRIVVASVPNASDCVNHLGANQIVYYCVDDFALWPGMERTLVENMERELISYADVLIATSAHLRSKLAATGAQVYLLSHGVDVDLFSRLEPKEHGILASIPKPRAGYFGLFDERSNQELLAAVATAMPGFSFVIAGPVTVGTDRLRALANVYFLGPLPYGSLPALIKGLDALLIPYVVNEFSASISPLKLKEYQAAGKPIISTALPECILRSRDLTIASTVDDWQVALTAALSVDLHKRRKLMLNALAGESWADKANGFLAVCADAAAAAHAGTNHYSRDIVVAQDFFPKIGGAHLWLYEVYCRWPRAVDVVTQAVAPNTPEAAAAAIFDSGRHGSLRVLRAEIDVGDINLGNKGCRRRVAHTAALIRSITPKRPMVLHCLRAFPEGLCALWSRHIVRRSMHLVVYAHGEEVLVARSSRQLKLIAQLVYRFADLVIANSRSTEALVKTLCPRARVVCIHPGVDLAAFQGREADVARVRAQWRWPADTVIVGTIARLEPRKNQAAVIRAIASLREEGLPIAYVCAGDGVERARLEALVAELGVQRWVRLTGALSESEKIATYKALDIYAMPSIRHGEMIEGFGIVFIEAAAAGIPAICGNVGGQPEAVLEGETGLVVDGLDQVQIRDAIKLLAQDEALRKRMGAAGLNWARSHSWADISFKVDNAVSHFLEESRAP